ncbi:hypothetical protein LTR37_007350 [Vermiconidia calcicola]|uniref:Uncharacterized protein n=1 Tax=Vermiconidia calcicola TaxID=1690605 RepID=A0ACC3NEJ8_9PEZI|nr:hypothetical protein LTR37_007350 [Vermiconidia calcicola]
MDRSLDEIISERPVKGRAPPREPRGAGRRPPPPRAPRREEYPRDGVRKNRPDDRVNIETDWVHDRYEEDRFERNRRPPAEFERIERGPRAVGTGTQIRVDNLHYDLTQQDLHGLFERIGPVASVRLNYDRMDRSEGTAFVTYEDPRDARKAVTEYDGCNANGQPIKLTLMPSAPAAATAPKGTLFDRVERPAGRSLFDRIEGGPGARDDSHEDTRRRRRNRSESPPRRGRPVPDSVDRYVPGGPRSRSPPRRRGTPREGGRRPGERREDSGRGARRGGRGDGEGRPTAGPRPKKTAEELDAEMADYFGGKQAGAEKTNGAAAAQNGTSAAAVPADDDIDMVE